MTSVLLDTNVILDYAAEREGFLEAAEKIFEAITHGEIVGCVSASAVTDIFYLLQKHYKDACIAISLLKEVDSPSRNHCC